MKYFYTLLLGTILLQSPNASSDTGVGIAVGIGGTVLVQELMSWRKDPPNTEYRQNGFPAFRCYGDEIQCAYERGLYDKNLKEYEKMKKKAYQCGRYGRDCEDLR